MRCNFTKTWMEFVYQWGKTRYIILLLWQVNHSLLADLPLWGSRNGSWLDTEWILCGSKTNSWPSVFESMVGDMSELSSGLWSLDEIKNGSKESYYLQDTSGQLQCTCSNKSRGNRKQNQKRFCNEKIY